MECTGRKVSSVTALRHLFTSDEKTIDFLANHNVIDNNVKFTSYGNDASIYH